MRIIRHELAIVDYQVVTLPSAGELLSVAQSRTNPNFDIDMWSLDYERGEGRMVGIYIVGTGNPMPTELEAHRCLFIGTVVTPGGLVWHVFEGPVR